MSKICIAVYNFTWWHFEIWIAGVIRTCVEFLNWINSKRTLKLYANKELFMGKLCNYKVKRNLFQNSPEKYSLPVQKCWKMYA